MMRKFIALAVIPMLALAVWIVVVLVAYGSLAQAPNPVAMMFLLLPVVYLAYAFGYVVIRLLRRVAPASVCTFICIALLALCAWRMPRFAHGVVGSDRPRESHIAVWTLLFVIPSIGGLVASAPDLWDAARRADPAIGAEDL